MDSGTSPERIARAEVEPPPSFRLTGGSTIGADGAPVAAELHIAQGRIVPSFDGPAELTVSGALVVPGLVDLHVHVFRGQEAGVDPDRWGAASGVTAMLDAGSAGAHLFEAFRLTSVDPAVTRIRAMVNVATIGITSFVLRGELFEARYRDFDALVRTVQQHRDVVAGIKVRASANVAGAAARSALTFGRQAADAVGLPLMVHLGPPPADVEEILDILGPGDILTHCCSGWAGNTLLDHSGRPRQSAVEARRRGVVFDVGHGSSSFDPLVAHRLVAAGFVPDTISSDIHSHSLGHAGTLPAVMNKFLALGLPLPDVLRRVTTTPARVGGFPADVGCIADGGRADLAVLRVLDRPYTVDTGEDRPTSPVTLELALTVRNGQPLAPAPLAR